MLENFWLNHSEIQALWLSFQVGIWSTLLALPFALFVGYQMARRDFWGKSLLESLILLPLVMPPVATGYLLLISLGSKSVIGYYLKEFFGIQLAFHFPALIIASMVVSFPLLVRSIRTAIELVDVGLEEASRILGVGKFRTFFQITLPLALPGVVSGTILAFARSLGEFGATITFAGNIAGETQTLPLAIYAQMQVPGGEEPTLRLVSISVVISFLAIGLSEWYIKKMKHDRD
ncbi:MAG: molybdate ABC transporter permease subunit [Bacteroidota bacterium]